MDAQLAATVYVTDPETHQTVELAPGTCPEPRLAALVTNKVAWVDGKLPRLPKSQDDPTPTSDGPDDASGGASDPSDVDSSDDTDKAAPAARKTAAKRAASSRSRGRDAADEGDSGA